MICTFPLLPFIKLKLKGFWQSGTRKWADSNRNSVYCEIAFSAQNPFGLTLHISCWRTTFTPHINHAKALQISTELNLIVCRYFEGLRQILIRQHADRVLNIHLHSRTDAATAQEVTTKPQYVPIHRYTSTPHLLNQLSKFTPGVIFHRHYVPVIA